jgi:adenosylcobyric acid synthase
VPGLGWLDVVTVFRASKLTRQRRGRAIGKRVTGYQIHHGRVTRGPGARPWLRLDDTYGIEEEGAVDPVADAKGVGAVFGTTLHGLFEEDGFRTAFLTEIARRRGKEFVPVARSFAAAREHQIDCLADLVDAHLDMAAVDALIKEGSPP